MARTLFEPIAKRESTGLVEASEILVIRKSLPLGDRLGEGMDGTFGEAFRSSEILEKLSLALLILEDVFCHSGENYDYGSKWTFQREQGISYSRFGRVRLVGIFSRYTHDIGQFFFRSIPQSTPVSRRLLAYR